MQDELKKLAVKLYQMAGYKDDFDKQLVESTQDFVNQADYILAHKEQVVAEVIGTTVSKFGANNKIVEIVKLVIVAGLSIAAAFGLQSCSGAVAEYDPETGVISIYQNMEQTEQPPVVQQTK